MKQIISKSLSVIRSLWNWFGFMFIVVPVVIIWCLLGLLALLIPFIIVAFAFGWVLYGHKPDSIFVTTLSLALIGLFYVGWLRSPGKWQGIIISRIIGWLNPDPKMELITRIIGVKISNDNPVDYLK